MINDVDAIFDASNVMIEINKSEGTKRKTLPFSSTIVEYQSK